MPTMKIATPESSMSFSRPVVYAAMKRLAKETGIDADKTILIYPDEFERVVLPNSTVAGEDSDTRLLQEGFKLTVESLEEFDQDNLNEHQIVGPGERWFINDPDIGLNCRPIFELVTFTLSVKYQTEDEASALRWRNMMRQRLRMYRESIPITFNYSYPIPEQVIKFVLEANEKKNKATGGTKKPYDYFKEICIPEVKYLVNAEGKQGQWCVADSQALVNGYFDFDTAPEKGSKEKDDSTWTIGFTLKFTMRKPTSVIMRYLPLVYNQKLSEDYIGEDLIYSPDYKGTYRAHDLNAALMGRFIPNRLAHGNPAAGFVIPSYDDFISKADWQYTIPFITLLTAVDPNNKKDLFSLTGASKWSINPILLDFMKGEKDAMLQPYGSAIKITLYEGDYICTVKKLAIDENLHLTTLLDLDMTKLYHIRLSFTTKFSLLPPDALKRLQNNPKALQIILDFLKVNIIVPSDIDDPGMIDIIDTIEGKGNLYKMRTVQGLSFNTDILEIKNASH